MTPPLYRYTRSRVHVIHARHAFGIVERLVAHDDDLPLILAAQARLRYDGSGAQTIPLVHPQQEHQRDQRQKDEKHIKAGLDPNMPFASHLRPPFDPRSENGITHPPSFPESTRSTYVR